MSLESGLSITVQTKERLQLMCMCSYHGNGVRSMVRVQLHVALVST